jgi:hypothetical protein
MPLRQDSGILEPLLFTNEDAKEGLAAYVEKRAPLFKGK